MDVRMWAAALALASSAAVMDAADWVNLGPASSVTAFAVDPSRPGAVDATGAFLYAVTAADVFRSPAPRERRNPGPVPFR